MNDCLAGVEILHCPGATLYVSLAFAFIFNVHVLRIRDKDWVCHQCHACIVLSLYRNCSSMYMQRTIKNVPSIRHAWQCKNITCPCHAILSRQTSRTRWHACQVTVESTLLLAVRILLAWLLERDQLRVPHLVWASSVALYLPGCGSFSAIWTLKWSGGKCSASVSILKRTSCTQVNWRNKVEIHVDTPDQNLGSPDPLPRCCILEIFTNSRRAKRKKLMRYKQDC